jgi:hypothetical protein
MPLSARELAPRARFDSSRLRPESRLVSDAADAAAWSFGRRVEYRAGLTSAAVLARDFWPAASDARVRDRPAEAWFETLIAAWELPAAAGLGAGAGADDRF